MIDLEIRRADINDAPTVARLVDALLVELTGSSSRYDARVTTAIRLLADRDRIFGFLAVEQDEEPVGVVMIAENAAIYAGGPFGVITELYVVPEKRSFGVAKQLIGAAAALGRERSWSRVEVGAPHQPTWARSLNFYLRNGFVEVGPRLQLLLSSV
jgi:GNAT superfamily N-acetyltransferase